MPLFTALQQRDQVKTEAGYALEREISICQNLHEKERSSNTISKVLKESKDTDEKGD